MVTPCIFISCDSFVEGSIGSIPESRRPSVNNSILNEPAVFKFSNQDPDFQRSQSFIWIFWFRFFQSHGSDSGSVIGFNFGFDGFFLRLKKFQKSQKRIFQITKITILFPPSPYYRISEFSLSSSLIL